MQKRRSERASEWQRQRKRGRGRERKREDPLSPLSFVGSRPLPDERERERERAVRARTKWRNPIFYIHRSSFFRTIRMKATRRYGHYRCIDIRSASISRKWKHAGVHTHTHLATLNNIWRKALMPSLGIVRMLVLPSFVVDEYYHYHYLNRSRCGDRFFFLSYAHMLMPRVRRNKYW